MWDHTWSWTHGHVLHNPCRARGRTPPKMPSLSLGGKYWRKTLVLGAVSLISLQICNGWHLFAFLCGFGKEERVWIQNSYKMAWHGVAWIGLFCLLLLWITFHINFRLWVDVCLASRSCTPLWIVLLFEKEIFHVHLLHIRNQSPTWRLRDVLAKSWSCWAEVELVQWLWVSRGIAGALPALQSKVWKD